MNIAAYGSVFNLVQNRQTLNLDQAKEILQNAFVKVGIAANNLGVSFDGTHLVPSADFMGQTHKKCEFTAHVTSQGVKVTKVSKTRQNAAKAKRRNLKGVDSDAVEYAVEYIKEYGTLRIEGVGGRKTNFGNGYTLTINSGDANEARQQAEVLTIIENNDKNDSDGVYKLTCMAEVAAIMEGIGLGKAFYAIAESIGKGEVVNRKLTDF